MPRSVLAATPRWRTRREGQWPPSPSPSRQRCPEAFDRTERGAAGIAGSDLQSSLVRDIDQHRPTARDGGAVAGPRGRPIVARGESREAAEPEAVLRDGHEQRRSTLLDTLTFHLGDTYASRLIPIHAGALGHPRRSKISHGQDPATVLRHAVVKPWLRLAGTARRCSAQQSRRRSVTDAASGSPPNAAGQCA